MKKDFIIRKGQLEFSCLFCTCLVTVCFLSSPVFSQNSPFSIWGTGLDGSTFQKFVLYADTQEGLLFDAPKDPNGSRLDISFNWRGGGTPPLFIRGTDANVGIGTDFPWETLHVNGTLGIGTWSGDPHSGLQIQYTDGGWGTTVFKHSRWGGAVYFKRNGPSGERTQLYLGGASDHVMEIYDGNNQAKVRFHTNDDSYFNGGNLAIGETTSHGYRLAVNGKAIAEEVVVKLHTSWPDYVFNSEYRMPSLSELEEFIKAHKHLPDVPTATEVNENGLSLGEMNAILLKKVEELTLYVLQMSSRIDSLDRENRRLKTQSQP